MRQNHTPGMHALSQVIFSSTSTFPLGHVSDLDIFRTAARNNRALQITGFMLRGEKWFCQVLEGHSDHLQQLMRKIARDARHANLQSWWHHGCQCREFFHWHTEHWGVSPKIESALYDIISNNDVPQNAKIAFVKAFAEIRRGS